MAFSDLVPVLVVIVNNIVDTVQICKSGEELEKLFSKTCKKYGTEATDINFDDGYMELEDGTSICMSWSD